MAGADGVVNVACRQAEGSGGWGFQVGCYFLDELDGERANWGGLGRRRTRSDLCSGFGGSKRDGGFGFAEEHGVGLLGWWS